MEKTINCYYCGGEAPRTYKYKDIEEEYKCKNCGATFVKAYGMWETTDEGDKEAYEEEC